ncbi:MAG TPA: hypothetical protein VNV62_09700 [Trebonia sp.]|jgi:hypothetical protein|nr:hypothetical protein [Trebonia sp.]
MSVTQVSELHHKLRDALERAEIWSEELAAASVFSTTSVVSDEVGTTLAHLRTRAASTLINVAMFGTFSSGKSFLVSGLQGHLEVVEVPSDGFVAEKFIGLLPSSPEPTSSCPAQVVPVAECSGFETSGAGFLRVLFTDSPEWEDICNSPAPAVLAAYATATGDVSNRLRAHWDRDVAQVEILLSEFMIPAKLDDLPGYGSPINDHDVIINKAIVNADCFIYVTRAVRTLDDKDLSLIGDLYTHCRAWKKRVIWVLTGIDEATQLNHRNEVAWRTILAENNKYLADNFKINGQPDATFIGDGFIAVSPAVEARAAMYKKAGAGANASRQRAPSQMDSLRQVLRTLIEQQSGRKHVADIAVAARDQIAPLAAVVSTRLREERLPIEQVTTELKVQKENLRRANTAIDTLRRDLDESVKDRVRRASRTFDKLASHLHSKLDATIRSSDIRGTREANEVQVVRTNVLQEWMEAPGGPAARWDRQLAQFREDLIGQVRSSLADNDSTEQLRSSKLNSFNIEELDLSLQRAKRTTKEDIVQRAALVLGVTVPIAAAGVWVGTALAASVVFPPAAAVAGAITLVYMGAKLVKRRATSLELMQQEWIADLDSLAATVKSQFEFSLTTQCLATFDYAVGSLEKYRDQLEDSMERLQSRAADPGYQTSQEIVDQLDPLSREGEFITATLSELAALG